MTAASLCTSNQHTRKPSAQFAEHIFTRHGHAFDFKKGIE